MLHFEIESANDPSFSIPAHVKEAIKKALDDGHTHYTAGAGIPSLREAVYRKMVTENRIPVKDSGHVLVTNGAMHALYIAFRALVEPGDEIVVPDPTWTETFDNVTLAGGVPTRALLNPAQNYRYEATAVEAAVTPRTRAIVINSPHNPTGSVVGEVDLEAILAVAEKHGPWVISDEAYEHVLFDGRKHVSPGAMGYDRVIRCALLDPFGKALLSLIEAQAAFGIAGHDVAGAKWKADLIQCLVDAQRQRQQFDGAPPRQCARRGL